MDKQIKVVVIILIINFSLVPVLSNYYAYYLPRTHDFTIQENGITNGTSWGVSITEYSGNSMVNVSHITTKNTAITRSLPYGYYHFSVLSPAGYSSRLKSGDFHLSESNAMGMKIVDFLKLYNLTFTQDGLYGRYNWSINLRGMGISQTHSGAGSNITFHAPAGNYRYFVSLNSPGTDSSKLYTQIPGIMDESGSGSIAMKPGNLHIGINFTTTAYTVDINVSSSAQLISENVNGVGVRIAGQTDYFQYSFYNHSYDPMTIMLPNGTYRYSSDNLTGYTISDGWGLITVNGSEVYRDITYQYGTGPTG